MTTRSLHFIRFKRSCFNIKRYSNVSCRNFFQSVCSQQSQEVILKEKFYKRKKKDNDNCEDENKTVKNKSTTSLSITEENQYEMLNKMVTPLSDIPYDEQLKMKWGWSRHILNLFCPPRHRHLCNIERTIPSPITEGYRNKSEMNIRQGIDGNMKTVGIFIGTPGIDTKKVVCVPPTNLINTNERHKEITQMYQDFIRSSPLPAMYDLFDGGYWRGLVIRTNNTTGDTMVTAVVHPQNFTDEEIQENASKLKKYFEEQNANITSLYHQVSCHVRCTNEVSPYQLLSGERYLIESLHDYKFQISPDSFFQINKPAAELLYSSVINMAKLKQNTVLLDLCCGTGAISILCSSHVRCAIGIDITAQAINDAKANARLNDVTNCQFIQGKIEDILEKVLRSLNHATDIIAVLNPTRNGVDQDVIKTIKDCRQISRLIYISCKADSPNVIKNFKEIRNNKQRDGTGFTAKCITPVDLFPHTNHCELALLFER